MQDYHKTCKCVFSVMGLIKDSFLVLFGETTWFYWFLSEFALHFRSYLNPQDSVALRLSSMHIFLLALIFSNLLLLRFCSQTHRWFAGPSAQQPPTTTMAEDADMRNELEEMQRRADQLADEVRDRDPGGSKRLEGWWFEFRFWKNTSSNVSI